MLYVLECMFYGFTCLYGGNDKPLQTTGESPTLKDIGVCLLGWAIVFICVAFIVYLFKYLEHKNKLKNNSTNHNPNELAFRKGFFSGIIYVAECIALGFLCMHGGTNRTLYSTGEKPTKKEVACCLYGWAYIILIIVSVLLICV